MQQKLLWLGNAVVMVITGILLVAHFAHPPMTGNLPVATAPGPAAP